MRNLLNCTSNRASRRPLIIFPACKNISLLDKFSFFRMLQFSRKQLHSDDKLEPFVAFSVLHLPPCRNQAESNCMEKFSISTFLHLSVKFYTRWVDCFFELVAFRVNWICKYYDWRLFKCWFNYFISYYKNLFRFLLLY